MIRYVLLILLFSTHILAQEKIELTRTEAETIFLQNNLTLLAEKLNIEAQRAEVIQARLWPNPEFSLSEVNLWKTTGVEPSPPLIGNFGRDQQIAFEINQLIQTAGKRKKLIALEEVDVAKAEQYFEELLRNLKYELRLQLTELQYTNLLIEVHEKLIEHISSLTKAYGNQLNQGAISKAEFMRLKAEELMLNREILKFKQEYNQIQKELKHLLGLNADLEIELSNDGFMKDFLTYENIWFEQIFENAKENRPDYQLTLLEKEYAQKLLDYEKAQRIPDLTFGVNYDRNGSTMLDFVGFGVSFDLPIFNRNKGNIQKAEIQINQAQINQEQSLKQIENEIFQAYQSLMQSIDFAQSIDDNYESKLDEMLNNYTKNFSSRNISMLEYFDFLEAYLENKNILFETQKEINHKVEELNYLTGIDL